MIPVQCIRLALLRVVRNRGISICQVMALSAIMLPLLVLLGLKYGILTSMKEQLLRNPAALEIHFSDVVTTHHADAERYRQWPETGFVIPCVSAAYSTVEVVAAADPEEQVMPAEMTPTAAGDPLLTMGAVPIPEKHEAVVSEALAEKLALQVGDSLRVRVWRNARREHLTQEFKVVGILSRQFCQKRMVYVPAEYNVAVEEFVVHGMGDANTPAAVEGAVYDGVLLQGEGRKPLADIIRSAEPELKETVPEAGAWDAAESLLLTGGKLRYTATQMQQLLAYTVEQPVFSQPWVRPVEAALAEESGQSRKVTICCAETRESAPAVCAAPPCLLVAPGDALVGQVVRVQLESPQGMSEFICAVEASPMVKEGVIQAEPELLALLNQAKRRLLIWDYREGGLRHPVVEFIALRMYASGLEAVEPLMEKLRAEGRDCRARLDAVHRVLQLERNLDLLFMVLSIGAGVGGVLSFGMSLFNAVELYRRDYALVQLLGADRLAVSFIPVVEALVITGVALLLSFLGFECMRTAISFAFADLADARTMCRLIPEYWLWFSLAGFGIAWLASWASVVRVLRISPDEILRES